MQCLFAISGICLTFYFNCGTIIGFDDTFAWFQFSRIVLSSELKFAMASWVKKVRVAGSCSFPTDSWKFPTEEIGCLEVQFCLYIPPKWWIFIPEFCIYGRKFSDRLKCVTF